MGGSAGDLDLKSRWDVDVSEHRESVQGEEQIQAFEQRLLTARDRLAAVNN
jgi:hypothetical protein